MVAFIITMCIGLAYYFYEEKKSEEKFDKHILFVSRMISEKIREDMCFVKLFVDSHIKFDGESYRFDVDEKTCSSLNIKGICIVDSKNRIVKVLYGKNNIKTVSLDVLSINSSYLNIVVLKNTECSIFILPVASGLETFLLGFKYPTSNVSNRWTLVFLDLKSVIFPYLKTLSPPGIGAGIVVSTLDGLILYSSLDYFKSGSYVNSYNLANFKKMFIRKTPYLIIQIDCPYIPIKFFVLLSMGFIYQRVLSATLFVLFLILFFMFVPVVFIKQMFLRIKNTLDVFFYALISLDNQLKKIRLKGEEVSSISSKIEPYTKIIEGIEINLYEIQLVRDVILRVLDAMAKHEQRLSKLYEETKFLYNELEKSYYEIRRYSEELSRLTEIAEVMLKSTSPVESVKRLVDLVKRHFKAYGVVLMYLNEAKNILEPVAISGYFISENTKILEEIPLNGSTAGYAIKNRQPILIENVHLEENHITFSSEVVSEVLIPLYYYEKDYGLLMISFREKIGADEFDKDSLKRMIPIFTGILHVQHLTGEVKESYYYLADRFFYISRLYEDETREHILRVSEYSRLLAEHLSLNPSFVEEIAHYSKLHDIGKLRIPRAVLLKPSKLTKEEFELIKKHTIYGADILGSADWLKTARNIALYHHERWDGSGYPFGLRGEEIPISARIVALADVYDALREKRSYKRAFSHEETVNIIVNGDGRVVPSHFDPKILDIFRKYHLEFAKIYKKFETTNDIGF